MSKQPMFINVFVNALKNLADKEVLKEFLIENYELEHLDMFKKSVIFGQFIYFGKNNGFKSSLFSDENIESVIDIIYQENINNLKKYASGLTSNKIASTIKFENIFFSSEDNPSYAGFVIDYKHLAASEIRTKQLLSSIVLESYYEVANFIQSYNNFLDNPRVNKIKVPHKFFFNYLIHPHILLSAKDFMYEGYQSVIEKSSFEVYEKIVAISPDFIRGYIKDNMS